MRDVLVRVFVLVQQDVGRFVQGRLPGLGGGEGDLDGDSWAFGVGVPVQPSGDALALDTPSLPGEVVGHGGEDSDAVLTRERASEVGRVAGFLVDQVGLGDSKDGHAEEAGTALSSSCPVLEFSIVSRTSRPPRIRMPRSPFRTCRLNVCHVQ